MITIECSAFFAAMNENTLTVSDPRTRRRPRLFQDLALLGHHPQLTAKAAQLLTLVRGQARSLAVVDVELARPVAQRLRRAAQLTRELRHRPPARAQQPDRFCAELRRVRRCLWHRQTSSLADQMAQPSDVHESGGTPADLDRLLARHLLVRDRNGLITLRHRVIVSGPSTSTKARAK